MSVIRPANAGLFSVHNSIKGNKNKEIDSKLSPHQSTIKKSSDSISLGDFVAELNDGEEPESQKKQNIDIRS